MPNLMEVSKERKSAVWARLLKQWRGIPSAVLSHTDPDKGDHACSISNMIRAEIFQALQMSAGDMITVVLWGILAFILALVALERRI